jgi:hypothetical protein
MPAALEKDWTLAQALYNQGVAPAKICKRLGIPAPTLSQRITRQGWKTKRDELSKDVGQILEERGRQWRFLAIDSVDRFMDALTRLPKQRVDKVARADVQSLKDLIETGLKAYGLDKGDPVQVRIGVWVGSSEAGVRPKTIDVQAVQENAPG